MTRASVYFVTHFNFRIISSRSASQQFHITQSKAANFTCKYSSQLLVGVNHIQNVAPGSSMILETKLSIPECGATRHCRHPWASRITSIKVMFTSFLAIPSLQSLSLLLSSLLSCSFLLSWLYVLFMIAQNSLLAFLFGSRSVKLSACHWSFGGPLCIYPMWWRVKTWDVQKPWKNSWWTHMNTRQKENTIYWYIL